MIKQFCDRCGDQLDVHGNAVANRLIARDGRFAVEATVAVDNTWNSGQLCAGCVSAVLLGEYPPRELAVAEPTDLDPCYGNPVEQCTDPSHDETPRAEALPPTKLANEQGEIGSRLALAYWGNSDGDEVYVGLDRRVTVWPSKGHIVADTRWLSHAIASAHEWAEAHLEVGDEVTGRKATNAPVGTTLRSTTINVVAVHGDEGWSIAGIDLAAGSNHEHWVHANTWRVVDLPGGDEA